LNILTTFVYQL